MSQFAPPDADYSASPAAGGQTSKLAVAALVCSLILCCPVTTVLGVLLGAAGVAVTGSGRLRGRGMAITALILGLVFTGAQFLIGNYLWGTFIRPVMEGPRAALTMGFAGDMAGFRSEFTEDGATMSDAEAQAFIDELQSRYGAFESVGFDNARGDQQRTQQSRGSFPYLIVFENATVEAEAELVFADQVTGQVVMKWGYILVFDDELGEVVYPPEDGGSADSDPES